MLDLTEIGKVTHEQEREILKSLNKEDDSFNPYGEPFEPLEPCQTYIEHEFLEEKTLR